VARHARRDRGGHLTAGEAVLDGLREAEEELGIAFSPAQVRLLGVRAVADRPVPGTVNREFQHVYVARSALPWTAGRPGPGGGRRPRRAAAARLHGARHRGVPQAARLWDGRSRHVPPIGPEELVPSPYLTVLAVMLERFAAGLEPLAL
jgi:hypothetical protein